MRHHRIPTTARWAEIMGYSRAVRAGDHIYVSGTAPVDADGKVAHRGDPYLQTKRCLEIIAGALREAGAGLEHVVRTRVFVHTSAPWVEVARAHGEVFAESHPATTLVLVSGFVDEEILVEIEADAGL